MWFYSQTSIKVLENLKRLTVQATGLKGGALLNVIYRMMVEASED